MTRKTEEAANFLFWALAAWEDEDTEIATAREAALARLDAYATFRAAGGFEPMVTTGGFVDWPGDRLAAHLRARIDRDV